MLPRLPLTLALGAGGPALDLPTASVVPFVILLLAIALLPLVAGAWWHHNRNKALIVAILAVPTAGYLVLLDWTTGQPTLSALGHEMIKYVAFILLLGSLYIVAGGIVLTGNLQGKPATNTALLALGCVLANLIGTTGASMLLIRPALRINKERRHTGHLPIFFIFTVSNLGGLLTPLGDPPLFLGFLNGVDFFWTIGLWREWLLVNVLVLGLFWCWDSVAYRRDRKDVPTLASAPPGGVLLRVEGLVNVLLLAGIIAGVLLQGVIAEPWGEVIGCVLMASMALASLLFTPAGLRKANCFSWGPILEVAILFVGIFVTMVPALAILAANSAAFNITRPWQYFWLTGLLSAFLDNAPTYLTFATMAAGGDNFAALAANQPFILQAISCGAVFMGALTYIGNGPNFMVKAIAEESGYKMPSFLATSPTRVCYYYQRFCW